MSDEVKFRAVGDKSRLVDRVVAEIEGLIVSNQLKPGDKLPPERELAEQLGVSRTVVRGAIHILFAKGLLDSRPGIGTTVQPITREPVIESLNLLLQSGTESVSFEHVYQVRSILEVETAGLAAASATDEDILMIKQVMADMEAVKGNPKLLALRDIDFHHALAQISGNPLLVVFVDLIRDMMRKHSELVIPHIDPQTHILPDHYDIIDRVEARDVAGARKAMQ
ncbi:MAG: FadR/GntR family transcriptional regulator, partial [Chloroflexota bacterium]